MTIGREKYQVLPDLPQEQYAALKADIAERGVMVAVEVDEYGAILDGHHRARACRELGINDYPVVVRSGLSETQKRMHAHKLNLFRRHLNREQMQKLVRDQLVETPEWSNNRIAQALGVDDKTVASARIGLEANFGIPKLDRLVGADGKARPTKQRSQRRPADLDDNDDEDQPRRKRRRDEWDEWADPVKQAKIMHAADLIGMGADPNSEKVQKLLREGTQVTVTSPSYDPLAGRSEEERREWHVFMLFLIQRCGYRPQGASGHVEWVLQRPFQNVGEWLGSEGDKFRKTQCMHLIPDAVKEAWQAFLIEQDGKSQPNIVAELEAIARESVERAR
jgi:ParB-like chromosome segregation protein Spo0J